MSSLSRRHHSESAVREGSGGVDSVISVQLSLELRLRDNCRELLQSYKESQDWAAVGQLAQSLVSNTTRINDLKRRLEDFQTYAHSPYLEKITELESDNRNPQPLLSTRPVEGEEDVATTLESSEVNQDKVITITPELANESLSKTPTATVSDVIVNKQESEPSKSCGEESIKLPGSDREQQEQSSPPKSSESEPCASQVAKTAEFSLPLLANNTETAESSLVNITGDSEALKWTSKARASQQQPPDHIHSNQEKESSSELYSTSEVEVQAGGEESVKINFDELDHIQDLMETLTDKLSKQYEHLEGCEPISLPESSVNGGADLAVPVHSKGSSESSEQFFSPRDSLYYEGGESESGDNDEDGDIEQFEDAESGHENNFASSLDEDAPTPEVAVDTPQVFIVTRVSVSSKDRDQEKELYCVESKKSMSIQTFGTAFSPVLHTYSEFLQLQEQLVSRSHDGRPECLKYPSQDNSANLEEFLNWASTSPSLRETTIFLNFLRGGCCGDVTSPSCGM